MKARKKLWIVLAVVLVTGVAILWLKYSTLKRAYEERLADYRKGYYEQIEQLIAGTESPEVSADIHAFMSEEVINQLLQVTAGMKIPLSETVSLEVGAMSFMAEGGTPYIKIGATLHFPKSPGTSISVRGAATFATPTIENGLFKTRLHIVALEPTVKTDYAQLALKGFFGDLAQILGQKQVDKLPSITLPFRQEFTIPVKGQNLPISFNVRPGSPDTLHGTLSLPTFELKSALKVEHAIFLADGLHFFLREDTLTPMPTPPLDSAWNGLSRV